MLVTMIYVCCGICALRLPNVFPTVWVGFHVALSWCHFQSLGKNWKSGAFDYSFLLCLMQILSLTILRKSHTLLKTVFALQTGFPLFRCFFHPEKIIFSLTGTENHSAISHLHYVFMHFMSVVALNVHLDQLWKNEPWFYLDVISVGASFTDTMMNHFLFPFAVFCTWEAIDLFILKRVFSAEQKPFSKAMKRFLGDLLYKLGIITEFFTPERKSNHYINGMILLSVLKCIFSVLFLFTSHFMLKNPLLLEILLTFIFIALTYYGSQQIYPNEEKKLAHENKIDDEKIVDDEQEEVIILPSRLKRGSTKIGLKKGI